MLLSSRPRHHARGSLKRYDPPAGAFYIYVPAQSPNDPLVKCNRNASLFSLPPAGEKERERQIARYKSCIQIPFFTLAASQSAEDDTRRRRGAILYTYLHRHLFPDARAHNALHAELSSGPNSWRTATKPLQKPSATPVGHRHLRTMRLYFSLSPTLPLLSPSSPPPPPFLLLLFQVSIDTSRSFLGHSSVLWLGKSKFSSADLAAAEATRLRVPGRIARRMGSLPRRGRLVAWGLAVFFRPLVLSFRPRRQQLKRDESQGEMSRWSSRGPEDSTPRLPCACIHGGPHSSAPITFQSSMLFLPPWLAFLVLCAMVNRYHLLLRLVPCV